MNRDLAAMLGDKDFISLLARLENRKGTEKKNGWTSLGRWIPYNSQEDKAQTPTINGKYYGAPTIGYGHKIFPQNMQFDATTGRYSYIRKIDGVDVDLFKGITDDQAMKLLMQDITSHFDRARSRWDAHMPMGKKGASFDDLPLEFKMMLTEVDFNVGLEKDGKWEWPSLAKAMKEGRLKGPDGMLDELSRTLNGKQLGRVKHLQDFFDGRLKDKPEVFKMFTPEGNLLNKPDVLKQLAQDLKDGMLKGNEFFKRFNKQGQVKLLNKLLADRQAGIKAENDAAKTFGQILEDTVSSLDQIEQVAARNAVEAQKALEAQLMKEVDEEMAKSEKEAPKAVDETDKVITEQPVSVEYFMRDDGEVVKMVGGKAEVMNAETYANNGGSSDEPSVKQESESAVSEG